MRDSRWRERAAFLDAFLLRAQPPLYERIMPAHRFAVGLTLDAVFDELSSRRIGQGRGRGYRQHDDGLRATRNAAKRREIVRTRRALSRSERGQSRPSLSRCGPLRFDAPPLVADMQHARVGDFRPNLCPLLRDAALFELNTGEREEGRRDPLSAESGRAPPNDSPGIRGTSPAQSPRHRPC